MDMAIENMGVDSDKELYVCCGTKEVKVHCTDFINAAKKELKKKMKTRLSFSKKDLETGMVVVYRSGEERMVCGQNFITEIYNKVNEFQFYYNNLISRTDRDLDIMKVYSKENNFFPVLEVSSKGRKLIWERKEG